MIADLEADDEDALQKGKSIADEQTKERRVALTTRREQ